MEINSPQVCVIMPVYNSASTLRYALASLIAQTYQNWICIIVDDGSTDETPSILSSLVDKRFKVYTLPKNCGRGKARDEALKYIEGEYLAYLDSDDMMHPDKLFKQVDFLQKNPDVCMVSCGCVTFDDSLTPVQVCGVKKILQTKNYKYGQNLPIILPAVMIRLELAKKVNYNHYLDVGEDFDYLSRCCNGSKYANIDNPLYYYRTGNVNWKKMLYYQTNSMRCSWVFMKSGLIYRGIYTFCLRVLKLLIYLVLLPIVGTERLVKMRGNGVEPDKCQKAEFYMNVDVVKKIIASEL